MCPREFCYISTGDRTPFHPLIGAVRWEAQIRTTRVVRARAALRVAAAAAQPPSLAPDVAAEQVVTTLFPRLSGHRPSSAHHPMRSCMAKIVRRLCPPHPRAHRPQPAVRPVSPHRSSAVYSACLVWKASLVTVSRRRQGWRMQSLTLTGWSRSSNRTPPCSRCSIYHAVMARRRCGISSPSRPFCSAHSYHHRPSGSRLVR
mmetsp:Transcript_3481/g.10727  ORF Transcript_3481/g.10727 Transcript_3481/m.10727 type:complete len:202 (+) Transcript_3481:2582-3187(+)